MNEYMYEKGEYETIICIKFFHNDKCTNTL
jgi:hypothetical protein